MTFHVGQKVVCVDGGRGGMRPGENLPQRGQIYTVRAVAVEACGLGLWLVEIGNPINAQLKRERGYLAKRFRPVVERKTDISIFTEMLNPSREQVTA